MQLLAEYVSTQLQIRTLETYGNTPLEAAEHTRFKTFHICGRTVRRQYNLFVVEMQIIEYIVEHVLRFGLVVQVLDVVYNKGVYTLIEIEELVGLATHVSCSELALEGARGKVYHPHVGETFFEAYAYGLDKVGLAHAGVSEIKRGLNVLTCGSLAKDSAMIRAFLFDDDTQ